MRHGYTNDTRGGAGRVEKDYLGPDAAGRCAREREALAALHGLLPVPAVHGAAPLRLSLERLPGEHGQDLIEQGHAAAVLRSAGEVLGRLHAIPAEPGAVLVHGDFGPNNMLFDPGDFTVTALLDWEFAHVGRPVEDLAWCEWIVRFHHAEHAGALAEFFAAYGGLVPDWSERQASRLARCRELEEFCERWEPGGAGARQWVERAAITASWRE